MKKKKQTLQINSDEHDRKVVGQGFSLANKNKKSNPKGLPYEKVREKVSLDQIVDDFGERLMRGEKLTIDDVLNKYPKLKAKLKPKLEIELMLIHAGQVWRVEYEKMAEKHKIELWQKLEKKIIDKQIKQIEERVALVKCKDSIRVKLRAEFIPMLLYVKGKNHRIGEGIRGITRFIKLLFLLDKETDLGKLVKVFYEFVPYKIGPFEPAVYQDLQVLEMAGIVKKSTYTYKLPPKETEIDEGFNGNNQATIYTLTDEGMKYAKVLINWLDKKDPEIALQMRRYKTYYAQAPLKKLLEYIYKKYPEFTTESEIVREIFM
jgi:hypothetical protein